MQRLGPIGGGDASDAVEPFNFEPVGGDLGAIRFQVNGMLEQLSIYSRDEVADLGDSELRACGNIHCVLLESNEYVKAVELRASEFIHGLRVYTNLRTTRWFGNHEGQLHKLQPNYGKIHGFFGTRDEERVCSLGIHCSAVTQSMKPVKAIALSPPTAVFTLAATGAGEARGRVKYFDAQETTLGAVVIKCDDNISSIRIVTPGHHVQSTVTSNQAVYTDDEHVFALRCDEYLVGVTFRHDAHLNALQFHTNRRTSEWLGGGGGLTVRQLMCPPGFRVCGLHGRTSSSIVDKLGLHVCENTPTIEKLEAVGLGLESHQFPYCDPLQAYDLKAVLVTLDRNFVAALATYSKKAYAALTQRDVEVAQQEGKQWFVLEDDEFITSMVVRAGHWIDGVQFFTNQQSSPYYGGQGGDMYRLEAKPAYKIYGFFGSTGRSFTGTLGALSCRIRQPENEVEP